VSERSEQALWKTRKYREPYSRTKQLSGAGKIPIALVNAKMGSALNAITFLKAFYERNGLVVDAELRDKFVKEVPRTVNLFTAEQHLFVQQVSERSERALWKTRIYLASQS